MNNIPKGDEMMNSSEFIRLVHDLREKGWTDTEILNHLLIIEGDKPTEDK